MYDLVIWSASLSIAPLALGLGIDLALALPHRVALAVHAVHAAWSRATSGAWQVAILVPAHR